MRPAILFSLFADVTSLKGVGPRMGPLYERLCGKHLVDLLWHIPYSVIDRRYSPSLRHAEKDKVVTLPLTIEEHVPPASRGKPYRVLASDGTDQIALTYFTAKGDYLAKLLPVGSKRIVSGLLERYYVGWTMNHPDYIVPPERAGEIPSLEPVYSLTEGLGRKQVRKTIGQAIDKAPDLPEWMDEHLLKREGWPTWKEALSLVHDPEAAEKNGGNAKARVRLAYDELLADQLALAVIRKHNRSMSGRSLNGTGVLQKKLETSLPFTLTEGQRAAIAEIAEDMKKPHRMLRLLQGDVGSGKTIVALFAMLQAMESGSQAALMAPTEFLAKQHHRTLSRFLKPLGIDIGLLVGKGKGADRKRTVEALKTGALSLVVGTHAVFQSDVEFQDLALAIVDEQHRFGVGQRLQLAEKGRGVDILGMTATPIPRTLTLTAYGDMDVSRLTDKPAGRQPIDTRLIDMGRLGEVIDGIGRQIKKGAQIYWVCPLVEESEKSDLANATARAESLAERFGEDVVGLVHGRMPSESKDQVMAAFTSREIAILVSTTVIEVGIDVPNATLMVIEHAERFGLAQLHQLRGRVGRGAGKSTCLLLYQTPLGEVAKARLLTMKDTEDGFKIAEEDLRLRGPGEVLGTRQSGLPLFRLADLVAHDGLIPMARDDAAAILARDPDLASERGKALKNLLYLFEKDAAVKLFRSG